MKRSFRALTGLVVLLAAQSAAAKDLPNYNAYHDAKPVTPVLTPSARRLASGFASSIDTQRGVPSFVWSAGAPSVLQTPQLALATHEAAARAHLLRSAPMYGVSAAALDTAVVNYVHDLGHGGVIVSFRQVVDGVELYRSDFKVLMRRNHELVAISGSPHPSAVVGMGKNGVTKFKLTPAQALANALNDLYGTKLSPASMLDTKTVKANYQYFDLLPTAEIKAQNLHFSEPGRVKKIYFPMPDRLVPAYFVEVMVGPASSTDSDAYSYVIAADDGRLLYRANLKHYAAFNYRVYADADPEGRPLDGPIADWSPHPAGIPDGSYPPYILPNLVTMDGFNKNLDPWLAGGATVTTGNNVDAYSDSHAPDGFTPGQDFRADVTAPGTFDRTYNTALDPAPGGIPDLTQCKAAITDMFYESNWLEDWWYDSGFDEAAGNAQQDNFGRGGIGGDRLHAEGEDSSGTNNSNMSAMSDGASPRMQMFLWDGKANASLTVNPGNQSYAVGAAGFGPPTFNKTGTLVLGDDNVIAPPDANHPNAGTLTDGCEAYVNNVTGKIVFVDRGYCQFEQKAQNAQNAGAIGLIIANNVAGGPMQMAQGNPPLNTMLPVLSVSQADGATLRAAIKNGMLTATMTNTGSVQADGTQENAVLAHEWGHYLHLRQVQCGNQACGGMSEGWADFNAMMMLVRPGDNLDGTYAVAIYASQGIVPNNAAYFGIRRFPYSTDMNKDPLTFIDISDGQALPMNAPINANGGPNSEVHNAGEIWGSMMWESFAALLKNSQGANPPYSFAQARRRMSDYIVGGMKMTPADPTHTEQRDAILAAAAAADVNDMLLIAGAFAKRGAGSCAVSPPKASTTLQGVVEDFGLKPEVAIVSVNVDDAVMSCDKDGILDDGETGNVTITIKNTGTAPLTKTTATVSSGLAGVSFPNGPTATFGNVTPFATATATVQIALDNTVMSLVSLDLKVDVTDTDACTMLQSTTSTTTINYDSIPNSSTTDDVESESSVWTATSAQGPMDIWSRQQPMPPNHLWNGVDFGSPSDARLESPPLDVAAAGKFILTFKYRHQFEQSMGVNWDGGVIEVSTDNGMNWSDISMYGAAPYGGMIGDPANMATNVLKGRQGFVGQSANWPKLTTATIDMGSSLAGKTVKIRFRVGSDDAQDAHGWDIDDIDFQGITNKPFPTVGPNMTPCAGASSSSSSGMSSSSSTASSSSASTSVSSGSGSGSGGAGGGGSGGNASGCGCSTVGDSPATTLSPLVAFALLALRRRRRTSLRSRS